MLPLYKGCLTLPEGGHYPQVESHCSTPSFPGALLAVGGAEAVCALHDPLLFWSQAQKENYRQEKKRATKQLFSALTDPSVVIMADSLKVGRCHSQWLL